MSSSPLPRNSSASRVRRSSTGTPAKHRARHGTATNLQDLVIASSPPSNVPFIARSDGLARNHHLNRTTSQSSDSSDSCHLSAPHSDSPRDFRARTDAGAPHATSGSPTGGLLAAADAGASGGRRKSRRHSSRQRRSRPGSISPPEPSSSSSALPARRPSGGSTVTPVKEKEHSKEHSKPEGSEVRPMSSDSASPLRVRLSDIDSTSNFEYTNTKMPYSENSVLAGNTMSTSSEISRDILKLAQPLHHPIFHSDSDRTSSGAAATTSLTTIGEDGVLESTVPPLPHVGIGGGESVESSSESSISRRMFSPRYSSAASSPASSKRATLLRGFGRMHETVDLIYADDSVSSTSKFFSASQGGSSSSSFASQSLSRSTGVPLPHKPRRAMRVPVVARAASNSGSISGLVRSDEHHHTDDPLRRFSVPSLIESRDLTRSPSRKHVVTPPTKARPLEVTSLSSLSLSASSAMSSPLQSARTNEKSAVSSSDSTDDQPLAQRSRSMARFSATPPGAPPQLRTSTSSPYGLRLARESPQSLSAPHLTALIAPTSQVLAGFMPSMDSAGSSRCSLEFVDDDAADEAIDEEIDSIVEMLVSAHEAGRGSSPLMRHHQLQHEQQQTAALSESGMPDLNLDGDLLPDLSVRNNSNSNELRESSTGEQSALSESARAAPAIGTSSGAASSPLATDPADADSGERAATRQRGTVVSSTTSSATDSSSGSSRSSSSSSHSSSHSSSRSSSRGGSGSGSEDSMRRMRRLARLHKSNASPRKGQ